MSIIHDKRNLFFFNSKLLKRLTFYFFSSYIIKLKFNYLHFRPVIAPNSGMKGLGLDARYYQRPNKRLQCTRLSNNVVLKFLWFILAVTMSIGLDKPFLSLQRHIEIGEVALFGAAIHWQLCRSSSAEI